jgi:hypothetical protein
MMPIKFVTTFSKIGYDLYGKKWIDTFTKNVSESNITVDLYLDFDIEIFDSRINIINYDIAIPNHKAWICEFETKSKHSLYNKKMGVRFSYKAFVMQHALDNNKDCYVIWLDGDCIFKPNNYNFIENLLNNCAIACQREYNGGEDHIESGIVIFDVNHEHTQKFNNKFKQLYKVESLIQHNSPYDGFMIYLSIKETGINYINLNDKYGKPGIQSDPNETFLHPEINSRFHHNIGPTGKSQYDSWDSVNKKDEYFILLNRMMPKSREEIQEIRNRLIAKRNKL